MGFLVFPGLEWPVGVAVTDADTHTGPVSAAVASRRGLVPVFGGSAPRRAARVYAEVQLRGDDAAEGRVTGR